MKLGLQSKTNNNSKKKVVYFIAAVFQILLQLYYCIVYIHCLTFKFEIRREKLEILRFIIFTKKF